MSTSSRALPSLCLALALASCDETPSESADPTSAVTAPAEESPEPAPPKAAAPALEAPKDPNEACAQIVSVAFAGGEEAPEGITREAKAAQERADALRAQVLAGEDFRALATRESDAASKVRGGAIGTFTRDRWPEKHAAVKEAVFGLKVNEVSSIVEAPYGYTFARRCPVEKVHTRHVLIRYAGAKNAGDDVKRDRDAAQKRAAEVHGKAAAGEDFEKLARSYSEDRSAERGGDMGMVGRGLFVPPYEEAAFALEPGGLSEPVETVYGFHVIQRVE